jgi:catalase
MSTLLEDRKKDDRRRLGVKSLLGRYALIAAILAIVIAFYAYLAGYLTPGALTPGKFVDGFEEVNGLHPGFRRFHPKGVCVSGYFTSNGQGVALSRARVFESGQVPVLGRFSLGAGLPDMPDGPDVARGLGLQFAAADGEPWRMTMINVPVFPFRTPDAFYEQMLASKPDPQTGKPDPEKMKAFLARHPATLKALTLIKAHSAGSGFADSTFFALHAFRFVNAAGESTLVRWLLESDQPAGKTPSQPGRSYLFDTLIAQIHQAPLRWRLVVVVGQPGDPTDDPTLPWPAERKRVEVGVVTLDKIESDDTSPVADINFDPLVLPTGITPSDDRILLARSAIYSRSFTRRAGETRGPSAISPASVRKGD